MEKFNKQYRVDVNGVKSTSTRYADSEELTSVVKSMTKPNTDRILTVLVYSYPSTTTPEQNRGNYIVSEYCTKVAA